MSIASLTFVTGNFEKNSNIFNGLYTNEISITLVIYLSFKSWPNVPEDSNKFILESLRLKMLSKKVHVTDFCTIITFLDFARFLS